MSTIKQRNTHSVPMRTAEGTVSGLNDKDWNSQVNNSPNEDRNAPIIANHSAT